MKKTLLLSIVFILTSLHFHCSDSGSGTSDTQKYWRTPVLLETSDLGDAD